MTRSKKAARLLLEQTPEHKRRRGPPLETAAEDLRGRVVGTLKVIGYLCPDNVSPWWIVRCLECRAWDVRRGNAIRETDRVRFRCPGCAAVPA